MADQSPLLDAVADLLGSHTLDDPSVTEVATWQSTVEPVTKPVLEHLRAALGWPETPVRKQRPAKKRDNFQSIGKSLGGNAQAVVSIGVAGDKNDDSLEHALVWGVSWWGSKVASSSYETRLTALAASPFEFRRIDNASSGSIGTTLITSKSLSPSELREISLNDLTAVIVEDLTTLTANYNSMVSNEPPAEATGEGTAAAISSWLQSNRGLHFDPYSVAAFVTALQAKGFVILSGISGTGKTQLAVKIAELVTGSAPSVIPVRPDWRDNRSLLGYYNPITERYVSTDLLRQLLPKTSAEVVTTSRRIDFGKVRAAVKAQESDWLKRLKDTIDRLEHADPSLMSQGDLEEIWKHRTNGLTSLGQAGSRPFPNEILQTATNIIDTEGTVGEKLINVLHYVKRETNVWQWARCLRACAVFDLDRMATVIDQRAIALVLKNLGYGKDFDLVGAVEKQDPQSINEAFAFLRGQLDERFPDFDRYEKAIAPWPMYEQLRGTEVESVPEAPGGVAPEQHDPRFVILDEMNLARVEYYFSDFLSVLESDRDAQGNTVQRIRLHDQFRPIKDGDEASSTEVDAELALPPSLYVVGTVNTDETTHAFSPKVLDRAFTLELNDVDLSSTGRFSAEVPPAELSQALSSLLSNSTPEESRSAARLALESGALLNWLEAANHGLQPFGLHFGYRVRDEIARFVGFALNSPLQDGFLEPGSDVLVGSFDAAVLMKILPKFHGPRSKLLEPLLFVLAWAANPDGPAIGDSLRKQVATSAVSVSGILQAALVGDQSIRLPRVADKVARMLYDLQTTGFTSFA